MASLFRGGTQSAIECASRKPAELPLLLSIFDKFGVIIREILSSIQIKIRLREKKLAFSFKYMQIMRSVRLLVANAVP